jgi:septal ring factor EnvC (AmiA/AmiB activator)
MDRSNELIRDLEARAAEQDSSFRGELARAREEHRRLAASNELLKAEASERERNARELAAELAEKEECISRLSSKILESEQSLRRLSAELADREERLRAITGSLGWRVLSRYGPVKYGIVLPAYNGIKRVFSSKPAPKVTREGRAPRD